MSEKPLFIPLKLAFFLAFKLGKKTEEYRLAGERWNAKTCRIGRRVTLSLGYGKAQRVAGTITGFRIDAFPGRLPGWTECYGESCKYRNRAAACIKIELDEKPLAARMADVAASMKDVGRQMEFYGGFGSLAEYGREARRVAEMMLKEVEKLQQGSTHVA